MTLQSLPVSTFVDVTTSIATGGAIRLPFGRGLLMTTDATLSAGGSNKARLFVNIGAVTDFFGSSGDVVSAASVWFSADPQPQAMWIGRWATTDVSSELQGGTPDAAAAFTATNYSFAINGANVTAINLSTPTTYTAIATAIQTALVSVIAGATVTFDAVNTRFVITMPDGRDIDPPYLAPALDAGGVQIGTDLSPLMGMDSASSPTFIRGHDEETVVNAVNECVALATTGPPVAIMLAGDAPLTAGTPPVDTRRTLAAWANAGDYMFGLRETSAGALVTNETTSQLALAFDSNEGKTFGFFDNASALPEIGGLAILSAQRLNNPASIVTPHAKAVPGVAASSVDDTQYAELERKRANVVTRVGGLSTLVGGSTSRAGYWADANWWLLWLKNEVQLAVWNAMRASRRLTAGIITDNVTGVLEMGVRNGGILAGGTVDASLKADIIATTGNENFSGVLAAGYLLWVESYSEQTQVDRENRLGRFKAWCAPSPAIHKVFGDIVLGG